MAIVAIITARGGSKRIPRKNIKLFCNRPIIEYSIDAALSSGIFDEVMVSTDDHEIAEIATKGGARVPFLRGEENSNDFASTADVICEVIESYKSINQLFDKGCCIYPTAPFINAALLKQGFELFEQNKFDVVFPVVQYSYPIQRSLRMLNEGKVEMLWPENYVKRSQDLESIYHDAGQFYWFDTLSMLKNKKLFTPNSGSIVINEMVAQDIDTIDDWQLAEIKYKAQNLLSHTIRK
jgi:pseudaminic acid cytidylyltransferase